MTDQSSTPEGVVSSEGLGLAPKRTLFDGMKAMHDEAWDSFCDAAPNGTVADLIVVGALRKKFLTELQALCAQRDRMLVALDWYAAEARACAKNSHTGNHAAPQALLASVTVLALDGGRRADEALRPND